MTPAAERAINIGRNIVKMIEEELSDETYSKASGFFDSVLERAKSIMATIETVGRVTTKQIDALANMAAGVAKWFHDGPPRGRR